MRYKLTEVADSQLEDILVEGIVNFGELRALKYQDSFTRTFELLAHMPKLGRRSERGHENEHRFLHVSHVIYYRIEAERIVIESILHGALIKDLWNEID